MTAKYGGRRCGHLSSQERCEKVLSVCIATFNGAKYIREQLDSILCQLSPEDEVIISDDGSADQTLDILAEYQKKDPRIKLFEGPRQGVIANFGYAIAQANGELIVLADQDDIWLDTKIITIKKYFFEHPDIQVVVTDLRIVDTDLDVLYPSYFEYRNAKEGWIRNLIRSNYIGAGMAFRSSLKSEILPLPKKIPMHDMWIGLLGGRKTAFIREPLTLYRRHESNATEIKTSTGLGQKFRWRWQLVSALFQRKVFKR